MQEFAFRGHSNGSAATGSDRASTPARLELKKNTSDKLFTKPLFTQMKHHLRLKQRKLKCTRSVST